jgi:hypothetical protein
MEDYTMTAKHTPAPWAVLDYDDEISIVGNAGTRSVPVADVMFDEIMTFAPMIEEAKANAHLMAAAPELLEALIAMREDEIIRAVCKLPLWVKMAKAIEKAEGRNNGVIKFRAMEEN